MFLFGEMGTIGTVIVNLTICGILGVVGSTAFQYF